MKIVFDHDPMRGSVAAFMAKVYDGEKFIRCEFGATKKEALGILKERVGWAAKLAKKELVHQNKILKAIKNANTKRK